MSGKIFLNRPKIRSLSDMLVTMNTIRIIIAALNTKKFKNATVFL